MKCYGKWNDNHFLKSCFNCIDERECLKVSELPIVCRNNVLKGTCVKNCNFYKALSCAYYSRPLLLDRMS